MDKVCNCTVNKKVNDFFNQKNWFKMADKEKKNESQEKKVATKHDTANCTGLMDCLECIGVSNFSNWIPSWNETNFSIVSIITL